MRVVLFVAVALLATTAALPVAAPPPPPHATGKGKGAAKGLWAKARDFFAVRCGVSHHQQTHGVARAAVFTRLCVRVPQSFHKHANKTGAGRMPGGLAGFGPSGFALSYEEMQKWYCGQATNTAKPVCATATKGAKGPHPLFNKKHAQHLDWVEMTKG